MTPPNTAFPRFIGKPNHTADTDSSPRRAPAGTGSCSYSSPSVPP